MYSDLMAANSCQNQNNKLCKKEKEEEILLDEMWNRSQDLHLIVTNM